MAINYTISINNTQTINNIEYTKDQLSQGLAQIRTQHNERNKTSLTDVEWLQWSYLQNLSAWYEHNKALPAIQPSVIVPVADWNALIALILDSALTHLYVRLTTASFVNHAMTNLPEIANANNIAVAAGKIDQALQVTQKEGAVKASVQLLLQTSNYVFTQEEKTIWNTKTDELNFTSVIHLI